MRSLYRTLPAFILLWVVLAAQVAGTQGPAGSPAGGPPRGPETIIHEHPLVDPGLMEFIKVFGLGGMIFVIWLFDYKRQRGLESIIEQYDKTQQAHLEAFREINDRNMTAFKEAMSAMQKIAEDAQSTAVLCAQVNTTVGAKLEQLTMLVKERHA